MSSDETTTTGQHELIVGKFDPYSDEVAITRDGIVLAHVYGNDGGAVKALALDFVLGRERAQKAEAENARLRERVAALEGAGMHALDGLADIACVHGRAFDSNEYPDWDSHCSVCAAMRPLAAALAQAGEGGAA